MEIAGRTALVTGAASGIGRECALALAREGARLVVVDRDERGAAVAAEIADGGGQAAFFRADVTAAADISGLLDFADQTFGGFDILHNNAGIMSPGGFLDQPIESWLRMIEVNFTSVVRLTHAAIPRLQGRGGGSIVQTASIAGVLAYPGSPMYASTKAAVVSFTRSFARLKSEANVAVNCICPEVVDTPAIQGMRQRNRDAGIATAHMALPLIPVGEVAAAVIALVRSEHLSGQAMRLSPGQPPELLEFPDWGIRRG